jgi:hypothetical protein
MLSYVLESEMKVNLIFGSQIATKKECGAVRPGSEMSLCHVLVLHN